MAKTTTAMHPMAVIRSPRVQAYFLIVILGSCITLSDSYKIQKDNILNQWFVKLGWFWTLVALLPMLFITTKPQDKEGVFHSIIRIIVSSTLWYLSVNLFKFIDVYAGYDISGHTFLLVFSNLLLSTELSHFKEHLENNKSKQQSPRALKFLTNLKNFTLVLSILWDLMLIQTALFYHTLPQKFIALIWAIGSWTVLEYTRPIS